MEAQRRFVPKHPKSLEGGYLHRPFREQTQSPVLPVLHLGARLGGDGGGQLIPPLDLDEDSVRVPSPVLHISSNAKGVDGIRQRLHFDSPSVARPAVVANADGEHHRDTPAPTEREVDHDRPGAQANVEGPLPSRRVSFIREFALREGISAETLQAIWGAGKNGYIASYDAHFVRFEECHRQVTAGSGRFSPRSINAGTLVGFLKSQEDEGKSAPFLKEASTSVSMACFEATDGAVHLGRQHSVVQFLKSVRQRAPVGPKKKAATEYEDVTKLFEEAWRFGPNEASCLGHLKEKLLLLLVVDLAARPSDLMCIYRIMSGRHAQIKFEGDDMLLRYFWPKEVMPGSSRSNATNTCFSTWVRVSGTKPHTINTVAVMKAFLRRSTDSEEFGLHDMPQLEGSFQPLFYAKRVKGKLQKASVDHCSNVIQAGIDRCDMGSMKTCHVRGASASKIVQLVPEALPLALGLGRWTTKTMFVQHYQAPVKGTWKPAPKKLQSNAQQILRWGFEPTPPPLVSVAEYERRPDCWVGVYIKNVGKVGMFEDGSYTVQNVEAYKSQLPLGFHEADIYGSGGCKQMNPPVGF